MFCVFFFKRLSSSSPDRLVEMVNHITALNPHVIYQTFTDHNEASTTTGLNYFMSKLRAVAAGSKMKIKSMDHNFQGYCLNTADWKHRISQSNQSKKLTNQTTAKDRRGGMKYITKRQPAWLCKEQTVPDLSGGVLG